LSLATISFFLKTFGRRKERKKNQNSNEKREKQTQKHVSTKYAGQFSFSKANQNAKKYFLGISNKN